MGEVAGPCHRPARRRDRTRIRHGRDGGRGRFRRCVPGEPSPPARRARTVARGMRTRDLVSLGSDLVMGRTLCGRLRTHSGRIRILTTQRGLGSLERPPQVIWQSTRRVAGKRVLVVDDDPDIRELLFTALEDEGFEVVPAGDGREALAIIRTFRPDVIVLDLMMPVIDGWQFASELRIRDEGDEDIPIVLLSAARDLRAHAESLSAAEIIEKPFDLADLLPKIARVASAA